ncbi:MAG: hypothetical protein ACYSR8_11600 [Planctomycetota bacterium]|jgi:hypothetical protein
MNPIRRKMASFLTEAARKELEALSPDSPHAKELREIEDVDTVIAEEIQKICNIATLGEITKAFLLVRRLKTASLQEKEAIESELGKIAEELVRRVETESGRLRIPNACRHLLLYL